MGVVTVVTKEKFDVLCEASRLSFSEEGEAFMEALNSLIEFTSVVKKYDCDPGDGESYCCTPINIDDLRRDNAAEPFSTEKLLSNTDPLFDCFVIPKIMD